MASFTEKAGEKVAPMINEDGCEGNEVLFQRKYTKQKRIIIIGYFYLLTKNSYFFRGIWNFWSYPLNIWFHLLTLLVRFCQKLNGSFNIMEKLKNLSILLIKFHITLVGLPVLLSEAATFWDTRTVDTPWSRPCCQIYESCLVHTNSSAWGSRVLTRSSILGRGVQGHLSHYTAHGALPFSSTAFPLHNCYCFSNYLP